jgi:hypothetical protein
LSGNKDWSDETWAMWDLFFDQQVAAGRTPGGGGGGFGPPPNKPPTGSAPPPDGGDPNGMPYWKDGYLIVDGEVVGTPESIGLSQGQIFRDFADRNPWKLLFGATAGLALGTLAVDNFAEDGAGVPQPSETAPAEPTETEDSIDPSKLSRAQQYALLRKIFGLPEPKGVDVLGPKPKSSIDPESSGDGAPMSGDMPFYPGSRNNPRQRPEGSGTAAEPDATAPTATPEAQVPAPAPNATPGAPAPAPAPAPGAMPGAGIPAPAAAADGLLPAESPAGAVTPNVTQTVPGVTIPGPVTNDYGTTTVYDPYVNRPPYPMTPEEYAKWELETRQRIRQDEQRVEAAVERDQEIAKLQAEYDEAKKASIEASDKLDKEYAKRAAAGPRALQMWLETKNSNAADAYANLKAEDDKLFDKAESLRERLDKQIESKEDRDAKDALDAERPYPKPPGEPKTDPLDPDKNAQRLGAGLVTGIMEGLGFDGSLFSNPLDWGITKLLTGGANYGLNVLKNMNPAGDGRVLPGGEKPPYGGSGTSLGLGFANGVLPGVGDFLNPQDAGGAAMPGSPSAVTAATSPSQNPGVAPVSSGGVNINTTVNANGVTDPNTLFEPAVASSMAQGRTTELVAPGGIG